MRPRPITAIALGLLIATLAVAGAQAAVTSSSTTTYYSVDGSTVEEIRADLDRLGPDGHDAKADGTISWEWTYAPVDADGCHFASVSVTLAETYVFPKWTRPDDATRAVRRAWDRYVKRLWVHERGHERISLRAANRIHTRFKNFGSRATCARLAAKANAAGQAILKSSRGQQAAYDTRTDHGATQGATFG